ncbi:hypothetical protein TW95_gp1097 [Pandoravirus inopinatum]|uniref:Uncharacterized protein n=1 Tax=Pandoravirus inopinatum TaxID=1605721 RepID=A0A0B5JA98_9VIRU|nr:hypothetical protein TW95_gp1097 [Pandoravirus inopinatum]AJF97831.1 hypothetical protein [Pandoravirus inopinatum]
MTTLLSAGVGALGFSAPGVPPALQSFFPKNNRPDGRRIEAPCGILWTTFAGAPLRKDDDPPCAYFFYTFLHTNPFSFAIFFSSKGTHRWAPICPVFELCVGMTGLECLSLFLVLAAEDPAAWAGRVLPLRTARRGRALRVARRRVKRKGSGRAAAPSARRYTLIVDRLFPPLCAKRPFGTHDRLCCCCR